MLFLGFLFGWGRIKPWSQLPLSKDKCEKQPWILVGRDSVCVHIYIHIYMIYIWSCNGLQWEVSPFSVALGLAVMWELLAGLE